MVCDVRCVGEGNPSDIDINLASSECMCAWECASACSSTAGCTKWDFQRSVGSLLQDVHANKRVEWTTDWIKSNRPGYMPKRAPNISGPSTNDGSTLCSSEASLDEIANRILCSEVNQYQDSIWDSKSSRVVGK